MGKRAARLASIKPGWVPLREAPFRFRASRNSDGGFSEGTSLDDLEATLTEISGASKAHIDAKTQTFQFGFTGRTGESWGGAPPWLILASAELRNELIEQKLDPEILFDKNLRFTDVEEQRIWRQQHRAMARATGVVWRQTMVREFNNALEAGQITLFARPTAGEPFQSVPPDVWPSYEIVDWSTGYAVGSDSSSLLSIHIALRPSSQRGRALDSDSSPLASHHVAPGPYGRPGHAPDYDYEKIRGKAFRLFNSKGVPDLANDKGWRTRADLKHELEQYCASVFGRRPARSTMDGFVDRVIQDWNSRKQAAPDKGK